MERSSQRRRQCIAHQAKAYRRLRVELLESRHLLAEIAGTIFHDLDGDGIFEPGAGETPIAAAGVYLDLNTNGQFDSASEPLTTTNVDGYYEFAELEAGTYTVRQVPSPGRSQLFPATRGSDNVLIPVTDRVGHVYDPVRQIQYITTRSGQVQRFDLKTRTLLPPLDVGVELTDVDITPDGRHLYVGEDTNGSTQSMIRKVDLKTGEVTHLSFDHRQLEAGVADIAIADNGKALFTADVDGSGGTLPLRQIDLASDAVSVHPERLCIPLEPCIEQRTRIFRSADRSFMFFMGGADSSFGGTFTYDAATETLPHERIFFSYLHNGAVSRDGSLIAMQGNSFGLSILNRDLSDHHSGLPNHRGGVAFNPVTDILYAGDVTTDDVVVYETTGFTELYRFSVGENLNTSNDAHTMSTTDDGRYLFHSTPSGVRMYELFEPTGHTVTVAAMDIVGGVQFGDHVAEFAPLAQPDHYKVATDGSVVLSPLDNDHIKSSGELLVTAASAPVSGGSVNVSPTGQVIDYAPSPGFEGIDTFVYTISDGRGRTDTATVTVTVKPLDGTSKIHGRKWNDLDRDGVFEPHDGETPLTGQVIFIDTNHNARLDAGESSTTTGADGRYAFDNLLPGSYDIAAVVSEGWEQTFPVQPEASSTLIPVPNRVRHVYDPRRDLVYISTSDGKIERFDIRSGQLLEAWDIGVNLGGLDLTQDLQHLYVAESQTGTTQGFVRKVDLDTGELTNLRYDRSSLLIGALDVAIADNNTALFTVDWDGSGFVPLYQIDLSTDTVSIHNDRGDIEQDTRIFRAADRSRLFFTSGNTTAGTIFTYDPVADQFPVSKGVGWYLNTANSSVSRNGSLIAIVSSRRGLSLMHADLSEVLNILPPYRGGLQFDAVRDVLYAVDLAAAELVAIHTTTFEELYRLPVGESLGFESYVDTSMSPDGELLFLSTPSGVRMFRLSLPDVHHVAVEADELLFEVDFSDVAIDHLPRAAADKLHVHSDAVNVPLDVLANDVGAPHGTLTVTAVGTTDQGGAVAIAAGGDRIDYTPLPGFVGIEHFSYTIADDAGRTHEALVSVTVKPLDGQGIIRGMKWHDVDGNGTFDALAGEVPLENWTVFLDLNSNGRLDNGEPDRQTDASGQYEFAGVPPGTYDVVELQRTGWKQTFPLEAGRENNPIAVADRVAHVYDSERDVLYISTSSGSLQRFDLSTRTLLAPWTVGSNLGGLDITPDNAFLYVTEIQALGNNGIVHKVDLSNGAVQDLTYPLTFQEKGSFDIAIAANGKALFTATTTGTAFPPIREIDLEDDAITQRSDKSMTSKDVRVGRDVHRQLLHFTDANNTGGVMFNYSAATDSFANEFGVSWFLSNANSSVNADASLIAQYSDRRGLSVFNLTNTVAEILRPYRGGILFDPLRNLLYAGDDATNEIVVIDVTTFAERARFAIGANVFTGFPGHVEMSATPDGEFLFMNTAAGMRMFSLATPTVHSVAIGADEIVSGFQFGNRFVGDDPAVIGRQVFYNNSSFDGRDPAANASDDTAVASTKVALFPGGTASFANYTSYDQGLNGLIIDIANLPSNTLTADDFEFRIGNDDSPAGWSHAPLPAVVDVRFDAGIAASARVSVTWPDQVIKNTWLEIRVLANANTGLGDDDVFYFGNAVGESGMRPTNAFVDAFDFSAARDSAGVAHANVDNPFDYNRDTVVDGADMAVARDNTTNIVTALRWIMPVGAAPPEPVFVFRDTVGARSASSCERERCDHMPPAIADAAVAALSRTSPLPTVSIHSDAAVNTSLDEQTLEDLLLERRSNDVTR